MPPSVSSQAPGAPVAVTGSACLSALGPDLATHVAAMRAGQTNLRPLSKLLGKESPHGVVPAGWIEPRSLLTHRKWSPLAMAALHVARQAVEAAGWTAADLREAALFVGTSRGPAAGWLSPWPGRRPLKLLAASNSLHSEPASVVSIELGIRGPWHVIANGCAAGLDALGFARLFVQTGLAPRALVVAADLPLVPVLLDAFAATGILSKDGRNDPFHPLTTGILPAEGAAAVTVEPGPRDACVSLSGWHVISEADDPLGMPDDGRGLAELLVQATAAHGPPAAICPHASGTANQASAEPAAILSTFPSPPRLLPLKPFTGHTIGASGLLELVLAAAFLTRREWPPLLPGLHLPSAFPANDGPIAGPWFKIASAMGGHHSLVVIDPPP